MALHTRNSLVFVFELVCAGGGECKLGELYSSVSVVMTLRQSDSANVSTRPSSSDSDMSVSNVPTGRSGISNCALRPIFSLVTKSTCWFHTVGFSPSARTGSDMMT